MDGAAVYMAETICCRNLHPSQTAQNITTGLRTNEQNDPCAWHVEMLHHLALRTSALVLSWGKLEQVRLVSIKAERPNHPSRRH